MNLPNFISQRISRETTGSFSHTINRIAVISVAVGLSAILLAFMILGGFKDKISNKIYDLNGHMTVTRNVFNINVDEHPISLHTDFYENWREDYPFIDHVQQFANKPALLKTDDEVQGVILKGIGQDYDTARFGKNLLEGRFPARGGVAYSREVVISNMLAKQLLLETGDDVLIYFVQDPPRYRKVTVCGIYETGLEEFDKKLVYGDLNLVRRINNWPDSLAGGLEIYLKDLKQVNSAQDILFNRIDYSLYIEKVEDKFLQLFDWLMLIDMNVQIFLVLVLIVAAFNMVSILLILILERVQMIGILNAMGTQAKTIRRIFFHVGVRLILKGMLIANLLGLGLGLVQQHFKIIKLDPKSYYMDSVPILISFTEVIWLNLLCLIIVSLTLFIPLAVINRIKPINSIRFD